jgi:hypothetical protein
VCPPQWAVLQDVGRALNSLTYFLAPRPTSPRKSMLYQRGVDRIGNCAQNFRQNRQWHLEKYQVILSILVQWEPIVKDTIFISSSHHCFYHHTDQNVILDEFHFSNLKCTILSREWQTKLDYIKQLNQRNSDANNWQKPNFHSLDIKLPTDPFPLEKPHPSVSIAHFPSTASSTFSIGWWVMELSTSQIANV